MSRTNRRRLFRPLRCQHLESRTMLACIADADTDSYCVSTGGAAGDQRISLHYDPDTGDLSVDADGRLFFELSIQSESGQFSFPNGANWNTGQNDVATGSLVRKLSPPLFGDIQPLARMTSSLSEYEVLDDLRIAGEALDPGGDGQFGTNDDQLIDLSAVDLIYVQEADANEPDSFDNPFSLTPANPMAANRSLHEPGDEDWYAWTATGRGRLSIEVFFEQITGDAELELYDSTGALLEQSSTTNRNESVHREVLPGETYLIRVFGFRGATQSHYDLVAYLVPEEDPVYVLRQLDDGAQIRRYDPRSLLDLGDMIVLPADLGAPAGLELGPNGLLYVSFDGGPNADQIVEWTPGGARLRDFQLPEDPGPEPYPQGFEVLQDGSFLVAQPNSRRVVHLGSFSDIRGSYRTDEAVRDATVIPGPQPTASLIQQPLVDSGSNTVSINPTALGTYWAATDQFIQHFTSTGRLTAQLATKAPKDVQQSADRSVWTVEENGLLRKREPLSPTGLATSFDGHDNLTYHFSGAGESRPQILSEDGNPFVRLTTLTPSNHTTIAFDRQPNQTGPADQGLLLSFDFRMTDDATSIEKGGCCGSAADGMGIGLFDTSVYGTDGPVHPAEAFPGINWETPRFPNALTIGLKIFEGDAITLNWQGSPLWQQSLEGHFDLNDNEFHRAVLQLLPSGADATADLWIDDQLIVSNVPLPNLNLTKLPDYRVLAGGRTGAAFTEADLDNLSLRSLEFFEDFQGDATVPYSFVNSTGTPPRLLTENSNAFARLTSLSPSNHNAIAFDEALSQTGPAPEGLLMSVDFRMSDDAANNQAGGCCNSAADGLGIGLFATDVYGQRGALNPTELDPSLVWESPFFSQAITIGFRIFENVDIVTFSLGGNQVLEKDLTGQFDLNDNQFHRTALQITVDDQSQAVLNLWLDGTPVFSDVTIEGFDPAEIPRYRVIAGGRTGGAYTRGDVDNIALTSLGQARSAATPPIAERSVTGAIALAVSDGEIPVAIPGRRADRDGDGLPDEWEMSGIDVDQDGTVDLNLAALGADPDHKDLFLEIDSVAGYQPSVEAIKQVIEAFANVPSSLIYNPDGLPGVNLHVVMDDLLPATSDNRQLPEEISEAWERFHEIRDDYFGTAAQRTRPNAEQILAAKDLVYRYALIGDRRGTRNHAGLAEEPGRNLLVTLGGWRTPGGTAEQQAAVLMHELGHTLGLSHGGDDHINFKPNYLSVMNYSHVDGATHVNDEPFLDFSRHAHNSPDGAFRNLRLDERQLNEPQGIGFPSDTAFIFETLDHTAPSNGPVDWNQNGSLQTAVVADTNRRRTGEYLKSYNDWGNLLFGFRNYHHSGEAGVEAADEDDTFSDQCSRFLGSHSDRYECNETPDTAAELPIDDILTIDEPTDEDWFFDDWNDSLDDFSILGFVSLIVDNPGESRVPPSVNLSVVGNAGASVPTIVNRRGAVTEYTFAADRRLGQPVDGNVRFFVHLQRDSDEVLTEDYRLSSMTFDATQVARWTGAINRNWEEPGNWQNGVVPNPGDEVVILSRAVNRDLNLQGSRMVSRLVVQGARPASIYAEEDSELYVGSTELVIDGNGHLTIDGGVTLTSDIQQQGGDTTLLGTAQGWKVTENAFLEAHGTIQELFVAEGSAFSPGRDAELRVAGSVEMDGSLMIDITAVDDAAPQVETIAARNVTLGMSSRLQFQVAEIPDRIRRAEGLYAEAIFRAPTIHGEFALPRLDQPMHIGYGIFLRALNTSVATQLDAMLLQTTPGDSNGDGQFNSADLIAVFSAGQYEDAIFGNSDWLTGDWNHDGEFNSSDLIVAFQAGNYERGPIAVSGRVDANNRFSEAGVSLIGGVEDAKHDR